MNIMLKLTQPRQLGCRCQARIDFDRSFVWVTIVGRAKTVSGPWVYDIADENGNIRHSVTEDKLL